MKTNQIFTILAIGIALVAFSHAAEVPPSRVDWPPGAEAIIDKAIAIKLDAQKKSIRMESDGWAAGHSFGKCMDELAVALAKSPELGASLEKEEGNDLKAKIALWALDRQARAEEYARIDYRHFTHNAVGEAAERRRVEGLPQPKQPPFLQAPQPKTNSRIKCPPPVDAEDAVEQNRLMMEYLYFAPPTAGSRWFLRPSRLPFSDALARIRNEKSLLMFRFDLENQIQAFPDLKARDPNAALIGGEILDVLNFGTIEAFRIVASVAHNDAVRAQLQGRLGAYQGWIYDAKRARLKAELEAMKRLAELEWQTDAEKELAGWIKAIPPIPEKPGR